jgi:hypothetical protein
MRLDDVVREAGCSLQSVRRRVNGAVALRGPNCASEIAQLRTLASWEGTPPPIARVLASFRPRPVVAMPTADDDSCDATLRTIFGRFKLNDDQASVIRSAVDWFRPGGTTPSAVLVHGVFGAGKTHTLVALIIALCTLLDCREGRAARVAPTSADVGSAAAGTSSGAHAEEDGENDDAAAAAAAASDDDAAAADAAATTNAADAAAAASASAATGCTTVHPSLNEGVRRLVGISARNVRRRGTLLGVHDSAAASAAPPKIRIMVASLTNTAVDTILLGLQRAGFNDFARVGSLPRIAKPILPHVMHSLAGGPQRASAVAELESMLAPKEPGSGPGGGADAAECIMTEDDKAAVASALRILKTDESALRELTRARVVGVTCAAASFDVLDGISCDICIMDECSQMVEPLSLVPLARARAGLLVAVGDPMQLPPQLVLRDEAHPLTLTMFDRLARLGYPCTVLRTQYRCHPRISAISNRLFYNGELIDGVSAGARAACVRGFPPVAFHNVEDSRERSAAGASFVNEGEAIACVRLTAELLHRGLRVSDIGIIALYRAQATHIRCRLRAASVVGLSGIPAHADLAQVLVSTVDAFQGAEREFIIVSCCRTTKVGFTDSPKRLNVTLTRARRHLVIFGLAAALRTAPLWREIIDSCEYVTVRSGGPARNSSDVDASAGPQQLLQQQLLQQQVVEPDDGDVDGGGAPLLPDGARALDDDDEEEDSERAAVAASPLSEGELSGSGSDAGGIVE